MAKAVPSLQKCDVCGETFKCPFTPFGNWKANNELKCPKCWKAEKAVDGNFKARVKTYLKEINGLVKKVWTEVKDL